jgi:hypothetical protein
VWLQYEVGVQTIKSYNLCCLRAAACKVIDRRDAPCCTNEWSILDLPTTLTYPNTSCRRMVVNGELERAWKEVVVSYSRILSKELV